jgi:hypothetical protein
MVKCSCGKTIDKVPAWLTGVEVQFVCSNCPNRSFKNIAHVSLELKEPEKIEAELSFDDDDDEEDGA